MDPGAPGERAGCRVRDRRGVRSRGCGDDRGVAADVARAVDAAARTRASGARRAVVPRRHDRARRAVPQMSVPTRDGASQPQPHARADGVARRRPSDAPSRGGRLRRQAHWYVAAPQRTPAPGLPASSRSRHAARAAGWLDALWPAIAAEGLAARTAAQCGGARRGRHDRPAARTLRRPDLHLVQGDRRAGAGRRDSSRPAGVPVAPLFWAATDDADFAEASTTWVACRGAPSRTHRDADRGGRHRARGGADRRSLGAAGESGGRCRDPRRTLDAMDAVRAAYARIGVWRHRRTGHGGRAFVALLRRVLEPLGHRRARRVARRGAGCRDADPRARTRASGRRRRRAG